MLIILPTVISLSLFNSRRRTRWVMLQNRNIIVAAESKALMVLTIRATSEGSLTNWENRLAVSMKNGAPGG